MKNDDLQHLSQLIDVLRGEDGCPWDREQKAEDILSDLVEEVHELQWAHAEGNAAGVLEESGDVLFVAAFALKLLGEAYEGLTVERAVAQVHEKIVRRHPHVFGDKSAGSKEEGLAHWNRMKAAEKEHRGQDELADIPGSLPPVRRAEKIQRRVARFGFDWADTRGIFAKLREEIDELEDAVDRDDRVETVREVGDLIFSVINLSRFLEIDAEQALTDTNAKFVRRYRSMKGLIAADKKNLDAMTLEEMDRYWERAKREER